MAHKTLIDGASYNVVGGTTMVDGAVYRITAGKTLVDGTAYSIPLVSSGPEWWVGWKNASWEDINNLCYAKQTGLIDSWPSDVVLGGTKSVTLSQAVLSTTTHDVMIIGIDWDGEGTLTFQTKNTLAKQTTFSSITNRYQGTDPDGPAYWNDSNCLAKKYCQDYYNAFPGKNYIKTVVKQTSRYATDDADSTYVGSEENVWLLSLIEGGCNTKHLKEFTKGGVQQTYPWYASSTQEDRKTSGSSAARSRTYGANYVGILHNSNGVRGYMQDYYNPLALAPAFVIGNPEAQTIE